MMIPAKQQAEEMIEMMLANSTDRISAKQCAAIACQYIINNNPQSSKEQNAYPTSFYWAEVLNQIIHSKTS